MTLSYISFGANIAGHNSDLTSALLNVRASLEEFKEVGPVTVSRGFRTPAFPPGSGPDFLNAALSFETSLGPHQLLAALHDIEQRMGRTRRRRWEPRVCDLDLLAMADAILPDRATVARWMEMPDAEAMQQTPDGLLLPHPRLHRRAFVLLPLADIAPDWRHPILGSTVARMVDALDPAELEGIAPF